MRHTPDSLRVYLQILHYRHRLLPYLDELTEPQLLAVCHVFACGGQKLRRGVEVPAREKLIATIIQAVDDATPLMSVPLNIALPALETENDLSVLLGDWHAQA